MQLDLACSGLEKFVSGISLSNRSGVIRIGLVILSVLLFLFALDLMGTSFRHLSKSTVESIIQAASNPFIGLFIGLLITALIQSSSTSTTMIVAAVASGSINFTDAVPMIMGANIGTTITSTIISMGYIANREQFKRALSAGVVHDFFNVLVVIILFPLELNYGILSSAAHEMSSLIITDGGSGAINPVPFRLFNISPLTEVYTGLINNPLMNLIISFLLLFAAIKIISKVISNMLIGNSQEKLQDYIFNDPTKSFLWGTLITAGVQSSSITTSVVVPFVAANKISLKKITPFIIGANVGTTITAFIAVFFKSYAVVSIALVHLIFNLIGVLIFLPFPWVRNLLITAADQFAGLVSRFRFLVVIYILLLFFLLPFCLIYFTKGITL